jgi:pSer/pThr/pTyr-binding forkhead associated (FHA) protein
LVVSDPTVSRQHAEIERSGEEVSVRDLGSSNGTFVNGAKLDSERVLCPGDTVQFGAVRYRFEA